MEYHPTPTTTPSLSSILATLSSYAPPPRREYVLPEPTPKLTSQPSASTIVTWPPALRHMLALAQNQDVIHRIRHLIQEQHSHERQWWRGREELVRKQQGREEARGKLDGVLYVSSFSRNGRMDIFGLAIEGTGGEITERKVGMLTERIGRVWADMLQHRITSRYCVVDPSLHHIDTG